MTAHFLGLIVFIIVGFALAVYTSGPGEDGKGEQ